MGGAFVELGVDAFDSCVYDGHGGRKEASKKKTNQAFAREQSVLALIIQTVALSLRKSYLYYKSRTQDLSIPLSFRKGSRAASTGA